MILVGNKRLCPPPTQLGYRVSRKTNGYDCKSQPEYIFVLGIYNIRYPKYFDLFGVQTYVNILNIFSQRLVFISIVNKYQHILLLAVFCFPHKNISFLGKNFQIYRAIKFQK